MNGDVLWSSPRRGSWWSGLSKDGEWSIHDFSDRSGVFFRVILFCSS
jgi:hypothetical protein